MSRVCRTCIAKTPCAVSTDLFTYDLSRAAARNTANCRCTDNLGCTRISDIAGGYWVYPTQGFYFVPNDIIPPIHVLIGYWSKLESPCPQYYSEISRFVPPDATPAQIAAITTSMWQEWSYQKTHCPGDPPPPPPDGEGGNEIIPDPPTPPWIPTPRTLCNTQQSATCSGLVTGGPTIIVPAGKYCQSLASDDDAAALQAYLDALAYVDAQKQANSQCYGESMNFAWPFQTTAFNASGNPDGPCCTFFGEGTAAGNAFFQFETSPLVNYSAHQWSVTMMVSATCFGELGLTNATVRADDICNAKRIWMAFDGGGGPPWQFCGSDQINYIVAPGGCVQFNIVGGANWVFGPHIPGRISGTACISIFQI